MKNLKYAKHDLFMVLLIIAIISLGGFAFYQNSQKVSYSATTENNEVEQTTTEEGQVSDEAAVEEADSNASVTFTPTDNVTLKETNYTLEEVYKETLNLKNQSTFTIDKELNLIYQDFYSYFPSTAEFMNMYGEKYTYDEYMFVKTYHVMKDNSDVFGMYLATYNKCQTFNYVTNHSRDSYKEEYCQNE